MRIELLVLPFICTALLSVLVPLPPVRADVAAFSFALWLLVCNSIHGINAVVWTGNTDEHAPVWCDIATKLILGAVMALAASGLCIMRKLEHAASNRPLHSDFKARRNWVILEISLCVIAPLLFMVWHCVFQNHRFDILRDYGCAASVYPSAASVIMWVPPLVCCVLTFVLGGVIIRHTRRASAVDFSQHILSRLSMESSHFFGRLTITIVHAALLFMLILFSLFTTASNSTVSWARIHADYNVIHVVTSSDNPSIAVIWWGLRILSFVYVLLSVTLGDARHLAKQIRSRTSPDPSSTPWSMQQSRTLSVPTSPPRLPKPPPLSLDIKSGWDDTWDRPSPLRSLFSPSSSRVKSPTSPSRSPTGSSRLPLSRNRSPTSPRRTPTSPSRSSASFAYRAGPSSARSPSPTKGDDEAFLESTLTYLGSPMANALGLSTPIVPVPPARSPPRKVPSKTSPVKQLPNPTTPESKRLSGMSAISSVFDAHWPQPPESPSPPSSRTPSPYGVDAVIAHARADSVGTLAHLVPPPPGLAGTEVPNVPPVPEHITAPERSSLRTVRGQWNRTRLSADEDVIYETSGPQAF